MRVSVKEKKVIRLLTKPIWEILVHVNLILRPLVKHRAQKEDDERGRSLSARITYFFDKVSESFLSFRGGLSLSCPRKLRRCTCTPTYRVYEVSALYLSLRFLLLSLLSSSFFLCFIFNIGTLTKPHRSLPRKKWSKFPSAETGKDAFWISNLMRAV